MLKLNSRSGIAKGSQHKVFNFLSDFRNFMHLFPEDKIDDIEVTENTLRFTLPALGQVGLKIGEKVPYDRLVIEAMEDTSADFTFRIYISENDAETSTVSLDLDANLNMFVEMMAKTPLQQFLNLMIEKVETIDFNAPVQ